MRLHEWIALERGYFQAAGIAPMVRWDIVSGIMSSWQGKPHLERPQGQPFVGAFAPVDIINHCALGSSTYAWGQLRVLLHRRGIAHGARFQGASPDSVLRVQFHACYTGADVRSALPDRPPHADARVLLRPRPADTGRTGVGRLVVALEKSAHRCCDVEGNRLMTGCDTVLI